MSYQNLIEGQIMSDIGDVLNGITTRKIGLPLELGAASDPALYGNSGICPTYNFSAIGKEAYSKLVLCDRLARDVNATIEIVGAPLTSESSKEVSFDVEILALDPVAGTAINAAATGTVQIVDHAVPATANEITKLSATVTAATYFGDDVYQLGLLFTRVSATTDLTGGFIVSGASLTYEVNR